jgi:hypothetical protein
VVIYVIKKFISGEMLKNSKLYGLKDIKIVENSLKALLLIYWSNFNNLKNRIYFEILNGYLDARIFLFNI